MTKTVRIYGVEVEFTDQAPGEDGVYWWTDFVSVYYRPVHVECGYCDGGMLPNERGGFWSAPLAPSPNATKALAALTTITSGHFYQSSCRGGEMERLMNQAIEVLGGGK